MTVPNTVEPISIVDVQLAVKEERKEPEEQSEPCAVCYDAPGAVRQLCGSDCELQVCAGCAGQLVRTALDESYAGVVPTIRCACRARRVVPMATWGPLLDAEAEALFFERAASTLSLQCASCHSRGTLLRTAEQGAELAEAGRLVLSEDDELSALLRAFEAGTELPAPVVERVYASFGDARAVMESVVATVADPERRARLQMSHLARDPFTKTLCHKNKQCFRCKTRDEHEGKTCEEVQAERASDVILHCPQCNIALAKGDGCSSISCMCGHSFSWSTLLREHRERQADELAAWYEQHLRTAAYLRAEAAGFAGSEEEHWLAAEAELGTLQVFAVRALWTAEPGQTPESAAHEAQFALCDAFVDTRVDSDDALVQALAATWAESRAEFGDPVQAAKHASRRRGPTTWATRAPKAYLSVHAEAAETLAEERSMIQQAMFGHRAGLTGQSPLEFAVSLQLRDAEEVEVEFGRTLRRDARRLINHLSDTDEGLVAARAAAFEGLSEGMTDEERMLEAVHARHPTRAMRMQSRRARLGDERTQCALAWARAQGEGAMEQAVQDYLVSSWRSYFESDEAATRFAAETAGRGNPPDVPREQLLRPSSRREAARVWLERFPAPPTPTVEEEVDAAVEFMFG